MKHIEEVRKTLDELWGAIPFSDFEYQEDRDCVFNLHEEATTILYALEADVKALVAALRELHAMVQGECPSLLNEDSGGNERLALEIEQVLSKFTEAK